MAIISKSKRFIKAPSCQKVRPEAVASDPDPIHLPDSSFPARPFLQVINGIWTGRVIYQAASVHAIIADVCSHYFPALRIGRSHTSCSPRPHQNYKTKPIGLYNPHKAPLLDHYRLRVPRVRAVLELTKSNLPTRLRPQAHALC